MPVLAQFSDDIYEADLVKLEAMKKEDVVALLKRHSDGFTRGHSKYRGVQ